MWPSKGRRPILTWRKTALFITLGSLHPKYAIISLPDGNIEKAQIESEIPCRWKYSPTYVHSFGMTENYFIICESPLAFDILHLMKPPIMGISSVNALKFYRNENTRFRIMSRKTGKEVATNYFAPDFFNFHYMNCFEANGCIILDMCATDDNIIELLEMANLRRKHSDPQKKLTRTEPRRYVLPMDNIDSAIMGDELLKNVPEAKVSRNDFVASASAVK